MITIIFEPELAITMEKNLFHKDFTLGILGGGQLGKMLIQEANHWNIKTFVLDKDKTMPAAQVCTQFFEGDFNNFDDVYNFGKKVDLLTIEIEHVNIEALLKLEKEQVMIHPSPKSLAIIKDKGLQKEFLLKNNLPTSSFNIFDTKEEIISAIDSGKLTYPFVQKARLSGYDGNGVAIIRNYFDHKKLLNTLSIVEPLVDIEKELSVIVARNPNEQITAFSVSEMVFRPEKNLVDMVLSPARIDSEIAKKVKEIAIETISKFEMCGLLAVEFFLTKRGEIFINEVAPRPHNSGHHTMDNCYTSQFEQHIRAISNLPLGKTTEFCPAIMINLLGEVGYKGIPYYEGVEMALKIDGISIYCYGKTSTRAYRKMGHVNILGDSVNDVIVKSRIIKDSIKIISK